mgnify:CR=1 FL=1
MPRLFASDDDRDLVRAERDVRAAFTGLDLDLTSLAAVSNIFRAATAVRNHMEGGVLAQHELSWSACTSMFVLRVWGGGNFIDESRTIYPEVWALASPVEHLSEKSPPMLIIHGDQDETVDIKLSETFVAILRKKNLRHQYVVVHGGPHSFALQWKAIDLRPAIRKFLKACFGEDEPIELPAREEM